MSYAAHTLVLAASLFALPSAALAQAFTGIGEDNTNVTTKDEPPAAPIKVAVGFSGGDNDAWIGAQLAAQYHLDVSIALGWLSGHGFSTSQYSNADPTNIGQVFDGSILVDEIGRIAVDFKLNPAPKGMNNELFLVLGGHGDARGFLTYPPYDGEPSGRASWIGIVGALEELPPETVVTVFVDACYSGELAGEVEGQDTSDAIEAALVVLEGHLAGLTIMTSTDNGSECPAGLILVDSASEDGMQAWDDSISSFWKEVDGQGDGLPKLRQSGTLPQDW